MKFLWTTLKVKDLEKSLGFYRDLVGLEMDSRFQAGPGSEIAFLGRGETKLELICNEGEEKAGSGTGISVGFAVKSLKEALEFFKAQGYEALGPPITVSEELSFFFVRDPDGYTVQLVEKK